MTAAMNEPEEPDFDMVDMATHTGHMLYFEIAKKYNTLMQMIAEAVQNSVDANAKTIFVAVDLQTSSVFIVDDGEGVARHKFEVTIFNIGHTQKKEGKIGRFGLGLISPLNKCETYNFYSQSRGRGKVHHWKMVGKDISLQKNPQTPHRELTRLPDIPPPFRSAERRLKTTWHTMVHLEELFQDRTLRRIDLDDLESQIVSKLSEGMHVNDTRVHVYVNDDQGKMISRVIKAADFTGEPLPVVVYDDADCGRVEFQLYRAPKTRDGRKGKVGIMQTGSRYPITWNEYRVQAMGSKLAQEFPEAFTALGSGYFEGRILLEKVELDSSRTRFVLSDALRTSYMVIDRWYREHGKALHEEEQELRREERFKELAEESLSKLLEHAADDPELSSILDDLLGSAPAREPHEPKLGPSNVSPRKRRRIVVNPKEESSDTQDEPRDPRRKQRAQLRFGYEERPESGDAWDFEHEDVMLVFNTRHSFWEDLEEPSRKPSPRHDKWLVHYQSYVGLQVILLLGRCQDAYEFEERRAEIDQGIRPYSRMFIKT